MNGIVVLGDWRDDVPHGEVVKILPRDERWEVFDTKRYESLSFRKPLSLVRYRELL